MPKVSLRVYNREVEGLIDQGHLAEAMAHCRHILETFPKYLETYRLMGKASLEAKHYNEAVDVFSRVLMAVPDDFVSHVGMSIICDDQGKLDEAIWHMERAFEAQPSNSAIQAELQRLFGRRDGTQPPKIRMTRGALAHMYMQGELYPQAISEIKAVLAQDDERDDMKALLARAYFHAGQKADASDVCSQLLKRYPYSFDANRIMLELLQDTGTVENMQTYSQRVNELDPYSAYTEESVFRSNEVADAAVSLERLEYQGSEAGPGSEWSRTGINLVSTSAAQEPEWLAAGSAPVTPAPPAKPGGEIPDFLREAGWREASGVAEAPPPYGAESADTGEAELAPGDMPDWLKAMAPPDEGELLAPAAPSAEIPDWLGGLRSESPVSPEEPIPAWLKSLEASEGEVAPSSEEADLPEWLKSDMESKPIEPEPGAEQAFERPEASRGQGFFEPNASEEPEAFTEGTFFGAESVRELTPIEPEAVQPPAFNEPETAGELTPIEPETPPEILPVEAGSIPEPEFIVPASADEPARIEPETPSESVAIPTESVFESSDVHSVTPVPSIETLGTSAQEQDDALAWLESLAAKHGAKAEELVTDPNARSEKPPAWVEQARALSEAQAPVVTTAAEEPPLAAEQPAAEGFAQEASIEALVDAGEPPAEVTTPVTEEPTTWEQPVSEAAGPAVGTGPIELEPPVIEIPAPPPEPAAEAPLAPQEPERPQPASDETGIWLRELIEEDVGKEPAQDSRFAAEFREEEFVGSDTDMPDWMNKLDSTARTADETQPISPIHTEPAEAEASDLPDWLRGLDEEQKWPAPASISDELPAWLQGEPEPPAQPEPTAPTDWRHMEVEAEAGATLPESEAQPALPRAEPEVTPEHETELEAEEAPKVTPVSEPRPAAMPELEQELEEEPIVRRQPTPTPSKKTPLRPPAERRPSGVLAPIADSELATAQSKMKRGDIPGALEHYSRLIKKGRWLEEIIRDLREALYRYPVEVTIWQTLGDAYMRENRLQEALDSYTKAEELLR